jgi:hypothetical protein
MNTQIKHPTQQNNHPDKTILASIVNMLKNRTTPTTLYKVRVHTNILGNGEANKLAKEGSKIDLENDMPTQSHENAHSTPYWWCKDDDPHIDNKISNNFWTNPTIIDAQITQLPKFGYDQYMGNTRKHLFWNELFLDINCSLCRIDTWLNIYINFASTDTTKQSKKFENS